MDMPFSVSDDSTNTLFKLLFKNVQDKSYKVFNGKTDDEILSVLGNGNVCFSVVNNVCYFCVNINGTLKKVQFS